MVPESAVQYCTVIRAQSAVCSSCSVKECREKSKRFILARRTRAPIQKPEPKMLGNNDPFLVVHDDDVIGKSATSTDTNQKCLATLLL